MLPTLWSHITKRHPHMANFLEEIKEAIKNPNKITDTSSDINVRYYYKYYKHKESQNKYILVIVKYLNGEGFVISKYFVNNIK